MPEHDCMQRLEGGTITQGQGSIQYDAVFRLVVFRPLDGEVIVAKLFKSSPCAPNLVCLAQHFASSLPQSEAYGKPGSHTDVHLYVKSSLHVPSKACIAGQLASLNVGHAWLWHEWSHMQGGPAPDAGLLPGHCGARGELAGELPLEAG